MFTRAGDIDAFVRGGDGKKGSGMMTGKLEPHCSSQGGFGTGEWFTGRSPEKQARWKYLNSAPWITKGQKKQLVDLLRTANTVGAVCSRIDMFR